MEATAPPLFRGAHACVPWRALGTHRGDLGQALPATDRFVTVHGLHYLELTDGAVRRARGFFDLYDAATQLGLLPARGGPRRDGAAAAARLRTAARSAYLTVIVPAMPGACTLQTYVVLAGLVECQLEGVALLHAAGVPGGEVPSGPDVLCTSCGTASLFVKVIVSPAFTVRSLGSNWMFSIATCVPPPPPPPAGSSAACSAPELAAFAVAAARRRHRRSRPRRGRGRGRQGSAQEALSCGGDSRCSSSAFWACRRFSAWSQTAERSP